MLVASYAACSILRVLTQWGATLVIIKERESSFTLHCSHTFFWGSGFFYRRISGLQPQFEFYNFVSSLLFNTATRALCICLETHSSPGFSQSPQRRGVPLAGCRFPGPAARRLGLESVKASAPLPTAARRPLVVVVVVVVAAAPNYLRQASQRKYRVY